MRFEEFEEALRRDDFAVGDSFWLRQWEFCVVSKRLSDGKIVPGEPVFKWELSKDDFIETIRECRPDIEDPEEFYEKYEDDILDYFAKGFDVLVSGCGATYRTLVNDAVDEAIGLCKGVAEK